MQPWYEDLDDPAELFDTVVRTQQLPSYAESAMEVLGHPGQPLQQPLRPGDLIIRRALGEGRLAHVATVLSGELHPPSATFAEDLDAEWAPEGQFAHVQEESGWSHERPDRLARRITDGLGRLPADQLVLRPVRDHAWAETRTPATTQAPGVVEPALELRAEFDEFAPEASSTDFTCAATSTVSLHNDIVTAMVTTWNNSGEGQSVTGLCGGTPSVCPTAHQAPHGTNDAAHFDSLSTLGIRVVELAGLWGQNLTAIRPQSAKAAVSVKTRPATAPADALSFVGIKSGTTRHVHFARQDQRTVEAHVDGARWTNLGIEQNPGTDYHVFKRRYFEASVHRQWGREAVIEWLVGLTNFYNDRTGERVGVGDVSHIVGEVMTDHGSHRLGRDVDIYGLEAPPAGSTFPRSHWATNSGNTIQYRELTAPNATAARPRYSTPASGTAALTGTRAARVQQLWVTLLAYCAATEALLDRVVWHGANQLRADAVTEAQAAWDATVAAGNGTTARPGWRARWGPGPANRAAIRARANRFLGHGSGNYGPGRGWPLHQDHIHVRFR